MLGSPPRGIAARCAAPTRFGRNLHRMTDLDRFDRQLLNLVQQDAALTAGQLAERVSLSPSAIQRRPASAAR